MNIKNILYALVAILILSCSKDDEPQLSPAKFSIDQSTVDFDEVEIPTQKEIKLTVTNNGEEDLILKNYTFSGSNATEFTVRASETEETIQAGKTYEFSVIFKPTEEGSKTAILTIISNIGEHKVNISGKGTLEPVAIFNINPESKNFGDVEINTTAAINFTVANTGNAELVISKITLEGANADTYNTPNNSITLQSNAATGIKVTFAPLSTGNKIATLSIATNVGTYTVNLEGNGIPDPNAIVNIPDANFKASLLAHGTTITGDGISKIDINDDGEIQVSEAEVYSGTLNCNERNISDLTGIEAFVNISVLLVGRNQLTNLDVSKNIDLTIISCNSNQLTSLDLSKNVALTKLYCISNQLTSLNISKNEDLTELYCISNQLTSLDLSQNVNLEYLYCKNNQFTSLDISKNEALIYLACQFNKLTNLDVSKNVYLKYLYCDSNQLTSLDISKNVNLTEFYCFYNQLISLDVSKNAALTSLYCYSNQLISLNLANGNNNGLTYMKAQDNPNLTCIQIDSSFTPPNDGSWRKDDTASYNTNCQ
ncbi:choice-of-anchor D domain-containing protein [Tenacibaculum caenipelagi]|uniref:ASPM-SPD-2-Hydin domain-containing protein n=1 Tax=Tenacibaculum caenipelagi TaxID=1325435 RepID=A0A4R6TFA8_9FLAO|nr:choice-of-anchor D domain-containing protein [Tenacibaculum caenipelagi]TDQ24033.1 ASPM-SPD-2-Hydin domain-containing protein [Tenacibaculum caenipelagi]